MFTGEIVICTKTVAAWLGRSCDEVAGRVAIAGAVAAGLFVLSGCTSLEVESRNPNILEKEGMGLVRTVTSPINLLGPTYATYDHLYNESDAHVAWKVLGTPFVPLLTLPSGAFATIPDVVTGPFEMLTFSHASSVAYPWESYDYRVAGVWNKITPVLLVAVATAGAGAAAAADAMNGNSNNGGTSYNSGYNTVQPVQYNSGNNTVQPTQYSGGSGTRAPQSVSKPRTDIYTRNCPKHGEYDSRFSLGGCPACKAPKFAE